MRYVLYSPEKAPNHSTNMVGICAIEAKSARELIGKLREQAGSCYSRGEYPALEPYGFTYGGWKYPTDKVLVRTGEYTFENLATMVKDLA
jgi:hypothetical protein